MKKVVKNILLFVFVLISLFTPQITKSYEFDSQYKEDRANRKRQEIYDLYNMYKESINTSNAANSQFGVMGYNGACSTVTVSGTTVPLDDYIAGVIKQEMGGSNLEALKAQAIAARSFLLSTKSNSSSCSVVNGQSYQAYTNAGDGNSIYKQAAYETSGMVVSRNGEIAHTQYQSHPAGQFQKEDSSGWHVTFQRFADDESTTWTWNGPAKNTVRRIAGSGSLYGTEMAYNNKHNWGMSQTIAMYLAKGEGYTYDQIIKLFYDQPIVTLTDGNYTANIRYVNSEFGNVRYFNQGDFSNFYYSTSPSTTNTYGATIASHGCGPTSVAIIASSMLNREITPVETTIKVCQRGGCSSNGSYNNTLAVVLREDYGLNVKTTTNDQEVINALGTNRALVIAHMGPGTFTTGGHYIVLTGVNQSGQVSVADPGSNKRTEQKWFSFNTVVEEKKAQYIIVQR